MSSEQGRSGSERRARRTIAVALAVLTALVLTGVGLLTSRLLENGLRDEGLRGAQASAQLYVKLALEDEHHRVETDIPTVEAAKHLDEGLGPADFVSGVRLWNERLLVIYASPRFRGSEEPEIDDLRKAQAGEASIEITSPAQEGTRAGEQSTEELVEVSLPYEYGNSITGVAQVYLPYGSVRRGIAASTRRLQVTLVGSGLLLFLCLLPLLLRASRALTAAYVDPRASLAQELEQAIQRDELILHYQPKVDLRTAEVTGVEALVRWQHPERGLLGPFEFLEPLADHDVMRALTSWVLETGVTQCMRWQEQGYDLSVAVNVPPASLFDPEFGDEVRRLLDRCDVRPGRLVLELTEGSVAEQGPAAVERLGKLRDLGVQLSLDDFGTGYSSLARLSRLPIDELKIDRSFVLGMAEAEGDLMAVRLIADFGRYLGRRVVAEGVETVENWEQLKVLGCHEVQGYLVSRPVPAPELTSWLDGWLREPAQFAIPANRPLEAPSSGLPAAPAVRTLFAEAIEAPEAFISIDDQSVIAAWNRAAERTFGWSREEAVGRRLAATIIPPRYWKAHEQGLKRVLDTGDGPLLGKRIELPGLHRDGREFPLEVTLSAAPTPDGLRFNAFMHDISDRKRDERNREAEHEVARILTRASSLEQAGAPLLEAVGERLGWAYGALWLPADGDGDRLCCAHRWHSSELESAAVAGMTDGWAFEPGDGLPGHTWQQGSLQWVLDVRTDRVVKRSQAAARAGLRSAVAVPVESAGSVLGVLEFFATAPSSCHDEVADTLAVIGSHVGVFLERCRVQGLARDHAHQLTAISGIARDLVRPERTRGVRSAVCEAAVAFAGATTVVLKEPSPDGEWLVTSAAAGRSVGVPPLPVNGEPNGPATAFRSGTPLFVADAPTNRGLSQPAVKAAAAASVYFQPVRWHDTTVGVIVVAWNEPRAAMDEHLVEALRMLSDQAAIAIEHSDLLSRLERTAGIDDLTGLPNRRSWEDALRRELDRADRRRQAVCVGLIDFGPAASLSSAASDDRSTGENGELDGSPTSGTRDLHLKQVAAACGAHLTSTDYLGRYGETRLTVILAERSLANARAVMLGLAELLPQSPPFATVVTEWDGFESAERLLARAHEQLSSGARSA